MKSRMPVQVMFREYFEGIVAAIFLALFLRFFVFSILYIPGKNMEPGLLPGDFVIGWKLAYGLPIPLRDGERLNAKLPKRGDIVALRFPGDQEQILIRRIIGLPGEKIKISDGKLFINDQEVTYHTAGGGEVEVWPEGLEYPVVPHLGEAMNEVEVPLEHLFVLSDNRLQGDDSRSWGMVPEKNVESRMAYIWMSVDGRNGGFSMRWQRMLTPIK